MENPEISVIMPVYNTQKYVKTAVRSILEQSFKRFELLIIDDGSTDSSLKIVKEFKDERIRLLQNKKNRGLPYTRNKGITKSCADLIAFADSDDISHKDRLQRQYFFLMDNEHIGLCFTQYLIINQNNIIVSFPGANLLNFSFKWQLLWDNPILQPSVMFRKSLLKNHNLSFNKEYLIAEDLELWHSLVFHTEVYKIREPLLYYRVQPKSTFHSNISIGKANSLKSSYKYLKKMTGNAPPAFYKYLTYYNHSTFEKEDYKELLSVYRWIINLRNDFFEKHGLDRHERKQINKDINIRLIVFLSNMKLKYSLHSLIYIFLKSKYRILIRIISGIFTLISICTMKYFKCKTLSGRHSRLLSKYI